jgi:hypothetical protein
VQAGRFQVDRRTKMVNVNGQQYTCDGEPSVPLIVAVIGME